MISRIVFRALAVAPVGARASAAAPVGARRLHVQRPGEGATRTVTVLPGVG